MLKLNFLMLFLTILMSFAVAVDAAVKTPESALGSGVKPKSATAVLNKKLLLENNPPQQLPQLPAGYLDVLAQNTECTRFLEEIRRVKSILIDGLLAKKNLQGDKITIFVPFDQAMKDFGKVGVLHVKKQQAQDALLRFVGYHIILGAVSHKNTNDVRKKVRTVTGQEFVLDDVAQTVLYSVETPQAFIHVVNKVLVDPELKKGFLAKYYASSNGVSKSQSVKQQPVSKGLVTSLDALEKFSVCSRFLDEIKNVKRDTLLIKQRLAGGDVTLFIPTNEAMNHFGKVDLLRSVKLGDNALLGKFVDYHFVQEKITTAALKNSQSRVKTISKKEYKLADVKTFVAYSIETDDSIVHVVNNVLVDPELKSNLN